MRRETALDRLGDQKKGDRTVISYISCISQRTSPKGSPQPSYVADPCMSPRIAKEILIPILNLEFPSSLFFSQDIGTLMIHPDGSTDPKLVILSRKTHGRFPSVSQPMSKTH